MTFLKQDPQFKNGLDEFSRENSRIISDCRVCSILKTLPGYRVSGHYERELIASL